MKKKMINNKDDLVKEHRGSVKEVVKGHRGSGEVVEEHRGSVKEVVKEHALVADWEAKWK